MTRFWISTGGGLLCLLLTIVLLQSGAAAIRGRESNNGPEFTLETPDGMEDGLAVVPTDAEQQEQAIHPSDADIPGAQAPARNIAPDPSALPADVGAEPLERIAARMPLSPPAEPKAETLILRHPVAISAGSIRFGDRLVQLDGIEPQSPDRTCDTGGKSWPCGMVARTAFRNFLRARALSCVAPKQGWTGTLTSRCTIGEIDPAAWLAENGWAEALAGSPLEKTVAAAKQAGLGFFGADPRVAIDVPPLLPDPLPAPDIGVDALQQ